MSNQEVIATTGNKYYDNTRVSCSRECMRKYYFRHVRHWRGEGNSPALAFGLAWHNAMDVVWSQLKDHDEQTVLKNAMIAWDQTWQENGFPGYSEITPDQEKDLAPRTPGTAAEMIYNYIQERGNFIRSNEVLACEQPFAVPLTPTDHERWYVGRLDKRVMLTSEGRVIVGEHKTTSLYSTTTGIQSRQLDEYSPNSQVDGYLHALHMINGKQAKSVWVDLALVHKTVHNVFKFVPVDREVTQLSAWLWETNKQIDAIEGELRDLGRYREWSHDGHADFLPAFPKNTNSCSGKYSRCPYSDLCKYVANPEKRWAPGEVPDGFIEEKWEPFDVLKLEELGLEPEE